MVDTVRKSIGMSLGSTGVSIAVMHQRADEIPEILAFHRVNARFLRNGMIVNLEALQEAVSECRKNIASLIRTPFHHTTVNLCGSEFRSASGTTSIEFKRPTEINRKHLPSSHLSQMFIDDPEWKLVHVFPSSYDVDNQTFLTSPVGMLGRQLSAHLQQIYAPSIAISGILHAMNRCGIRISHIVIDPLGSFESLITEDEKEMGLWLLDIGGSVTQIAFLKGKEVRMAPPLPIGGDTVTSDIAIGMNTTIKDAEQIKIDFGRALPDLASDDLMVHIPPLGGGRSDNPTSQHRLAEIIKSRMEEILEMVAASISNETDHSDISSSLVLTGGGSSLPGTIELAGKYLGMQIINGHLRNVAGLTDIAPVPLCASAIGLALYGLRKQPDIPWDMPGQSRLLQTTRKLLSWLGGEA